MLKIVFGLLRAAFFSIFFVNGLLKVGKILKVDSFLGIKRPSKDWKRRLSIYCNSVLWSMDC